MLDDPYIGGASGPRLPSATAIFSRTEHFGRPSRTMSASGEGCPAPEVARRIEDRARIAIDGVSYLVGWDADGDPPWLATDTPEGIELDGWLAAVARDPALAAPRHALALIRRLADLCDRLYALDGSLPSVVLTDVVLGTDGEVHVGYLGELCSEPRLDERVQVAALWQLAVRLARHADPVEQLALDGERQTSLAELRDAIDAAWVASPELRGNTAGLAEVVRRLEAATPPLDPWELSRLSVDASTPRTGRKTLSGDPWIGAAIGPYHLDRFLGEGASGRVYEATPASGGERRAVKVVSCDEDDADLRERFERGLQAMTGLDHPNIVRVLEAGSEAQRCWQAMELVAGPTLSEVLRDEEVLPVAEAVEIARQLARALAAAHAEGVVHRDLKPANVLLCGRRPTHVKLADFGLARPAGSRDVTKEGTVVGTPQYMSPEQCVGRRATERSDLYALGVVLYRMLAGRTPFEEYKGATVMLAHTQHPAPRLSIFRPDVPATLEVVVETCLQKDPARRYPDACRLEEALAVSLDAPGSVAAGALEDVPAAEVDATPEATPTREPLSWIAGAVLAAAAVGAVAIGWALSP